MNDERTVIAERTVNADGRYVRVPFAPETTVATLDLEAYVYKVDKLINAENMERTLREEIAEKKEELNLVVDDITRILASVMLYRNRCLLYTSPSPRDRQKSRMPSSA